MKIGILTFHNAINYGGVLQAYALQKCLNEIRGIEAEVVDYHSPAVDRQYSFVGLKQSGSFKAFLLQNATTAVRKQKKISFCKFVGENIKVGPKIESVDADALSSYDVVVVGSDQVWNSSCTSGDKTYLLDIKDLNVKRISYAASIGNKKNFMNFKEKYHVDTLNALMRFSAISSREEEATQYITEMTGKECANVVDPVLLFGRDSWMKFLKKFEECNISEEKSNDKYVLVYNIGNFILTFAFAKALAKRTGLKIKAINKDVKGDVKFAGSENCSNVSPSKFVSLINGAQYIVTDSFHATAFSLMFKKKFFTIANPNSDNTNSRLLNILMNYKLEDRYITKPVIPEGFDAEMDYVVIEDKINNEREQSMKWLLNALDCGV